MKFKTLIIFCFLLLFGCIGEDSNEKKILETGLFEIEIPENWKHKRRKGFDSLTGVIKGRDIKLSYDWSSNGFANSLISTKSDFLESKKNSFVGLEIPYGEDGVTYVLKESLDRIRKEMMEEKGIKDSTLIKIKEWPIPENKIRLLEGQYYLDSKYKDTTIITTFSVPKEINDHNFIVDTIDHYRRKLIWPKENIRGTTGVYFESLESGFNFNLVGYNLNDKAEIRALKVLKTVRINGLEK